MEIDYSTITAVQNEIRSIEWRLYDVKQSPDFDKKLKVTYLKHRLNVLMALVAHSRKSLHMSGLSLEAQEKFLMDNKTEWECILKLVKDKQRAETHLKESKKAFADLENKKKLTLLDRIINML